jgi:hypothetical protein
MESTPLVGMAELSQNPAAPASRRAILAGQPLVWGRAVDVVEGKTLWRESRIAKIRKKRKNLLEIETWFLAPQ